MRRTIAEMRTATPQQDDYGAANGADLMDGTSEDVQPPCSLAIKSPSFSRACITLSISQSYIFFLLFYQRSHDNQVAISMMILAKGWLGTSNGFCVTLCMVEET